MCGIFPQIIFKDLQDRLLSGYVVTNPMTDVQKDCWIENALEHKNEAILKLSLALGLHRQRKTSIVIKRTPTQLLVFTKLRVISEQYGLPELELMRKVPLELERLMRLLTRYVPQVQVEQRDADYHFLPGDILDVEIRFDLKGRQIIFSDEKVQKLCNEFAKVKEFQDIVMLEGGFLETPYCEHVTAKRTKIEGISYLLEYDPQYFVEMLQQFRGMRSDDELRIVVDKIRGDQRFKRCIIWNDLCVEILKTALMFDDPDMLFYIMNQPEFNPKVFKDPLTGQSVSHLCVKYGSVKCINQIPDHLKHVTGTTLM